MISLPEQKTTKEEPTTTETPEAAAAAAAAADTPTVNPWGVTGDVNYDKLLKQFGTDPITPALVERFEKITGRKAHRWLRRGMFFSHRDLETILDDYEKGKKFFLYTGRGPSSTSMHVGHLLPFMFTQWLQEVFDVPLVIQMTDDEKHLFRGVSFKDLEKMTKNNAREIIALGFNKAKTFIFSDLAYMGHMYPVVVKIQGCVTSSVARGIFGFQPSDSIGKWAFPATQAAPSFSASFPHIFGKNEKVPCLIPQAIDQDPYFRMTRDVAPRLKWLKPAQIHSKFFPALGGPNTKMSSSEPHTCISLTDSPADIKTKIVKHAFSGGGATKEEHEKNGADLEVDVPYQWLTFFLEDDDQLKQIADDYGSGKIFTSAVKDVLIKLLTELILKHQEASKKITDEEIAEWMSVREMDPWTPTSEQQQSA